ncbi:hepatitis A virus cellular receptor 2 homolog [Sorex araneus]|uniref:hepatitis A virus cellular receptor 2 homolog n=1 Tax=Sorex araneus TaxID=42254 RepID=UPI002433A341|nr:hepatitis A virus cellular receptor 2 homolog [Sorex araneus]
MCTLLPFAWVLLGLPRLAAGAADLEVELGRDAHLPCDYAPPAGRPVPVCWGRGACPLRGCQGQLLSTDGSSVRERADARYQLRGPLLQGDVSLTIERAVPGDSGPYCCRVKFPGPMNDKRVTMTLTIRPAEAVPTTTVSRSFTDSVPWVPGTEGQSPGTEPPELLCDRNGSLGATVASEPPDAGVPLWTGLYIGAGVSAGLLLVCSAAILVVYSHRKKESQNSRLITLTEGPPTGLANRAAGEENIYAIEENVYEMEDPDENYCSVTPQTLA